MHSTSRTRSWPLNCARRMRAKKWPPKNWAVAGYDTKEMDKRAQEIIRREEANEADSQRLANAQKQTAQQVSAVSSEVSHVKTDVGGVKNDLGKTQNDLATRHQPVDLDEGGFGRTQHADRAQSR